MTSQNFETEYLPLTWDAPADEEFTDDVKQAALHRLDDADRENHARRMNRVKILTEMVVMAHTVFGANSSQVRYLKYAKVPPPPSLNKIVSKVNRDWRDAQTRLHKAEMSQKRRAQTDEMVTLLREHGFVKGADFTRSNARRKVTELLEEVAPGEYRRRQQEVFEVVP